MFLHRLEHPEALWLLLLAIPIGVLAWRRLRGMDGIRRTVIVALRLLVLTLLVLVMAGLSRVHRHDRLTVIGLADISGSIKHFADLPLVGMDIIPEPGEEPEHVEAVRDNLAYVRNWFRTAARGAERRPFDRMGIVVFDGRARAVVAPTSVREHHDVGFDESLAEGTNIAEAIRYGLAMFPPDAARRLVLISDGVETGGDAIAAAHEARGVPIDVVPITYRVESEVQIDRVEVPTHARPGQRITVRIVIEATQETTGRLDLLREGEPIDLDPRLPGRSRRVRLGSGLNVETVEVDLTTAAVNRFEAVFTPDDPADDTIAENNRAEAFTVTSQKGAVLVVDGVYGGRGRVLPEVLAEADMAVQVVDRHSLPHNPIEVQAYDLVILQNVGAEDLAEAQRTMLVQYVEEFGGGLLMVGGYNSFGAGGWAETPLASIMPVDMRIPEEMRVPTVAIAIVMDKSGSMSMPVMGTRLNQQEIANEGAAIAVQTLDEMDWIVVVAFDHGAETVVPLQRVGDGREVAQRIRSIRPAGGTNISAGMRPAMEALREVEADVKHAIVLSDGVSLPGPYMEMARQMRAEGMTVSSIAVGDQADLDTLRDLATAGGGEFYFVRNPRILPSIFIRDVRVVRRPLIREVTFTPIVRPVGSPITDGLGQLPPLRGLVLTQPRPEPAVNLLMVSPEGQPVLAHWQAGLGRVGAFTSDAHDYWANDWIGWPGYRQLWSALARTLARPAGTGDYEMATTIEGDELHITLRSVADPESGEEATPLTAVPGVVYRPDGQRVEVRLRPTGPGTFSTRIPAEEGGHYVVALTPREVGGTTGLVLGGVSRRAGAEYRRLISDLETLRRIAEITGGRLLDTADPRSAMLFDRADMPVSVGIVPLWGPLLTLAMAMFLLDVASRRIAWNGEMIVAGLAAMAARVAPGRMVTTAESAVGSMRRAVTRTEEQLETERAAFERARAASRRSEIQAAVAEVAEESPRQDASPPGAADKSADADDRAGEPSDSDLVTAAQPAVDPAEARRRALAALTGRGRAASSSDDQPVQTEDESAAPKSTASDLLKRRRGPRSDESADGG